MSQQYKHQKCSYSISINQLLYTVFVYTFHVNLKCNINFISAKTFIDAFGSFFFSDNFDRKLSTLFKSGN
ncbi:hypothetical protein RIR_jg7237.t1 [Rhizophagus irregularis DAOM 181602=DAOM 197198]|nr:hypothetical protein RIR_jg7237.t1 [Rhizophagus irregularis DAOM 181602=DAOM 197198]